jgi:hypothetical protein
MSNVIKSIVAVQAAVQNVVREKESQAGNKIYKYATLDAVLDELRPLLATNKLAVIQCVKGDSLVTTIIHESGETYDAGDYPLGVLDTHQRRGSAITYGRRYVLCALFGIAQEDDDAANATVNKPKPAQKPVVSVEERFAKAKAAIEATKDMDALNKILNSPNYHNLAEDLQGNDTLRDMLWDVSNTMALQHGGGNV